jgi:DNA-directed RNA polymerase subunit RPC12/RpoP
MSDETIPLAILVDPSNSKFSTSGANTPSAWTTPGSFYWNGSASPPISALPRSVPSQNHPSTKIVGEDGRPIKAIRMAVSKCICCSSRLKIDAEAKAYRCPSCDMTVDLKVSWTNSEFACTEAI